MFTDEEKKKFLSLLNQALPQHADAMVSARVRIAAGGNDFTPDERMALIFLFDQAEYSGTEQQIKVLLEQTSVLRGKLTAQQPEEKQTARPRHRSVAKKEEE